MYYQRCVSGQVDTYAGRQADRQTDREVDKKFRNATCKSESNTREIGCGCCEMKRVRMSRSQHTQRLMGVVRMSRSQHTRIHCTPHTRDSIYLRFYFDSGVGRCFSDCAIIVHVPISLHSCLKSGSRLYFRTLKNSKILSAQTGWTHATAQ